MQTNTRNPLIPTIGKWIVVAGLILQIITFSAYLLLAVDFGRRLQRQPTRKIQNVQLPWKRMLWVVYFVSSLIILRNVVRVVEYAQGYQGWISTHEFMLFVFDAVPMSLLMMVLAIFYPARMLETQQKLTANGWGWNALESI